MKNTPKRSRSSICLLLFVLFSMGASSGTPFADPMAQDPAYMIGRALPASICLFLGAYFAFRDRRPVARIVSSALVLLFAVGVGMGVLQGLSRRSANELMSSETATVRAGLFADFSGEGTAEEMIDNHDRRLREMARNLESSGDQAAVEIGRAVQIAADMVRGPDLTLATTLDKVYAPEFLNVVWMVEHDDLARQLEVAEEYRKNSAKALAFYQGAPQTLSRALREADIPEHHITAFMTGVNAIQPATLKVHEAHVIVAESYLDLIAFIADHRDSVVLDEEGGYFITPDETLAAFYAVWDPMGEAQNQLDAALVAHAEAMNRP